MVEIKGKHLPSNDLELIPTSDLDGINLTWLRNMDCQDAYFWGCRCGENYEDDFQT